MEKGKVQRKVSDKCAARESEEAGVVAGCCNHVAPREPKRIWNANVRDQPRNIEISQPMSPKRSLQVSTYLLLHRQGSVMRMMMKPGSMMNLVTGVGGE